jgi:hypothetical protein
LQADSQFQFKDLLSGQQVRLNTATAEQPNAWLDVELPALGSAVLEFKTP